MVSIKPFRAVRPNSYDVDQIASLPYDVVSKSEVLKLVEDNPKSFLNIDRTDVRFETEDADEVYELAKDKLADFMDKGWLIKEEEPALYIYRLLQGDRLQYGLVTTIAVADYADGHIKRHEFTRPDKEKDRIRHNDCSDANTSPIFLTMRKNSKLKLLLKKEREARLPLYTFDSFNHTNHCIWRITDPATIENIQSIFAEEITNLYIADGHHRMESAYKVSKMRQEAYPDAPEEASFNYFLGVIFSEEELTILPYNRIVEGDLTPQTVKIISQAFDFEKVEAETFTPKEAGTIGMFANGDWYKLTIKKDKIPADPVAALDASLLQNYVLSPVFGIENPRTDQRIEFVGGIHPIEELMARAGFGKIAFSMYQTTMEQLLNVADHGEVMPPKSTWFEPKLLSGLFVHPFESEKYLKSGVE